MKLKIDHEADALYLCLADTSVASSEEVTPGVIVDFDSSGHAVGIEVLYLSQYGPGANVRELLIEQVPLAR